VATQVTVRSLRAARSPGGDRVTGMAASQAELVHRGAAYDVQVDTTHTEALDCARVIAGRVR
jgi:chloramphenicol 3-O phosphotransferase